MQTDPVGWLNGNPAEPVYPPQKGSITTCAFIICANCGKGIHSMGGPRSHVWCEECTSKKCREVSNED